jgi:hypothetical protein
MYTRYFTVGTGMGVPVVLEERLIAHTLECYQCGGLVAYPRMEGHFRSHLFEKSSARNTDMAVRLKRLAA